MGVEIRTEGELVHLRCSGRIEPAPVGASWTDALRAAAEREGGPILVVCEFRPGLELPVSLLAAGARQTLPVLRFMRAVALVASGEPERSMLRASVLVVGPPHPIELFEDEESALTWLDQFRSKPARTRLPAA